MNVGQIILEDYSISLMLSQLEYKRNKIVCFMCIKRQNAKWLYITFIYDINF